MSTLPRHRLIAILSIALVVSVAGIAASQDGVDAPFSVSGAELATAEDLVRAIGNLSSNGELRPIDHGPPRQIQNYLPREAQHFLDQLKEIEQRSRPDVVPRTWLLGPEAPELLRTAYRLRAVLENAGKPTYDCPRSDTPEKKPCSVFSPDTYSDLVARVESILAIARRVARDAPAVGISVEDLTDVGVMRTVTMLFEQSLRSDERDPYASSISDHDREAIRRRLYGVELLARHEDGPIGRAEEFGALVLALTRQAGIGEGTKSMILVHLEFLRARGALQSVC